MSLCSYCRAIPMNFFRDKSYSQMRLEKFAHHPSGAALYASAEAGCNLCYLICDICNSFIFDPISSLLKLMQNGDPTIYLIGSSHKLEVLNLHVYLEPVPADFVPPLSLYAQSDHTFRKAAFWIRNCVKHHEECNIRYHSAYVPTRLVDVGQRGQSPRLILAQDCIGEDIRYSALSHCWGKTMSEAGMSKMDTLQARLRKLPMKDLPRTFRDAIFVTRKLGIKYLWIDSLCIIQDSTEDWQKEAGAMRKIYSHAFCTIASAGSGDSEGGLFCKRWNSVVLTAKEDEVRHPSAPSSITFSRKYQTWQETLRESPLSRRGWTLQERELSPRILYYANQQILWECRHIRASEISPKEGEVGERCLDLVSGVFRDPKAFNDVSWKAQITSPEMRYNQWRLMIEDYTSRSLTNVTDKLPALSGLANEFSYLLNDQYVAGLWRNDLLAGLGWKRIGIVPPCFDKMTHENFVEIRKREAAIRSPSWSWAKVDTQISYSWTPNENYTTAVFNPKILDVHTTPAGSDPNGEQVGGFIILSGHTISMTRRHSGLFAISGAAFSVAIEVHWDFPHKHHSDVVRVLGLGTSQIGLVLAEAKNGEYIRVGVTSLHNASWFSNAKLTQLKIV